MGDMVVKGLDESLLKQIGDEAARRGVNPEEYAAELHSPIVAGPPACCDPPQARADFGVSGSTGQDPVGRIDP